MDAAENMNKPYDLVIVMPIYNEEACIVEVITAWLTTLQNLKIRSLLLAINDGSRDSTAAHLEQFTDRSDIRIINKPNAGHGPTILMGYQLAIPAADWVFQTDSDGEMPPELFPVLWQNRHGYDALFGVRTNRRQPVSRKIISLGSRILIRVLSGGHVTDVNVPYRLMRSAVLASQLPNIPTDTFAPNVIIAGLLSAHHAKILNYPVPYQGRRTGTVSIKKWKLWRSAFRSSAQTFRILARHR